MSVARFRVAWPSRLDGAEGATIEIDRANGIFAVRPLRRRRVYRVTLAAVAEMVIWRIAQAERREKERERAKARKARRAARKGKP